MKIVVQKYGGSSLRDISKIKQVADNINKKKKKGYKIVVVVSAMGKSTDHFVDLAKKISHYPSETDLDLLLAAGEQISTALVSMALNEIGCKAVGFTGYQAGIATSKSHTKAKIIDIDIDIIKKVLDQGKIAIVAGFQGITDDGRITTLGRGGSDTTAVALAAKLKSSCEIYTDVDGIYTLDPRLYKDSKKLDFISYEEMMEMASLGAGIMHSRSVELAQKFKVPIYVGSSQQVINGTIIKERDKQMEERAITGMSVNDDDIMITISKFPYDPKLISNLFKDLAKNEVNVDMISQTAPYNNHISISFTAPAIDIKSINAISKYYSKEYDLDVEIDTNISKISVVGIGMRHQSGVAAKLFSIFADNNIGYKQITTSEIRITFTIDLADKAKTIEVIAKNFDL